MNPAVKAAISLIAVASLFGLQAYWLVFAFAASIHVAVQHPTRMALSPIERELVTFFWFGWDCHTFSLLAAITAGLAMVALFLRHRDMTWAIVSVLLAIVLGYIVLFAGLWISVLRHIPGSYTNGMPNPVLAVPCFNVACLSLILLVGLAWRLTQKRRLVWFIFAGAWPAVAYAVWLVYGHASYYGLGGSRRLLGLLWLVGGAIAIPFVGRLIARRFGAMRTTSVTFLLAGVSSLVLAQISVAWTIASFIYGVSCPAQPEHRVIDLWLRVPWLVADVALIVWIWRMRASLSSMEEEPRGFPIKTA